MNRRAFLVSGGTALTLSTVEAADGNDDDLTFNYYSSWQGQDIVASGNAIDPYATYALRIVEEIDINVTSSSFIREVTADESGTITIETEELEPALYFLRGPDLPQNPELDYIFEVYLQELEVGFNDSEVYQGLGTVIDIESTRGIYDLFVSVTDGLDKNNLLEIFLEQGDFEQSEVETDSGGILLKEIYDGEYNIRYFPKVAS
ncbi:hypothetical protein [Natrialba sp. INN-245]|uniref:hypothetical protein n=1 Tax=Natrialba sp. INN-245 TaxID=2690967 RepID=UPI0013121AFF|nr:hypothetical protein [Natrialba sp. INN-245]MWV40566.1 hypothetical protein [Natrialba sp. INN-245]